MGRPTVTLPDELAEELRKIAEREGSSVSWLIRRFAKKGVEAYYKEGKL